MAPTAPYERIESDALNGLRGLAALHVVLFHNLLYSSIRVWISGSLEMPFFFLLSGYTLTLAYGRTTHTVHSIQVAVRKYLCRNLSQEDVQSGMLRSFDFFRNRFARIMPMYYLANILALPLYFIGNVHYYTWLSVPVSLGAFIFSRIVGTVLPIGMILPALFWPFLGVGWTVSTLWCFYLCFPIILPIFQTYSSGKASKWLLYLFWIQGALGTVFGLLKLSESHSVNYFGYWLSTSWGITRLPVFAMGILSALIRLRQHRNNEDDKKSFLFRLFTSFVPFWDPALEREGTWTSSDNNRIAREKTYGTLIDMITISHLFFCLLLPALLSAFADYHLGDILNHAFQMICVNSLLVIIDGLTRDGGQSALSSLCRTRAVQQLGRCSMSLYLIHEPLRQWGIQIAHWGSKGSIPNYTTPLWLIPVVLIVSVVVAWILTVWVEEPLKKKLRTPVDTEHAQTNVISQRENPSETNEQQPQQSGFTVFHGQSHGYDYGPR